MSQESPFLGLVLGGKFVCGKMGCKYRMLECYEPAIGAGPAAAHGKFPGACCVSGPHWNWAGQGSPSLDFLRSCADLPDLANLQNCTQTSN